MKMGIILWLLSMLATSLAIKWGPCPLGAPHNPRFIVECGYLPVPLDYNNPESLTINVFVLKSRAAALQPSDISTQVIFLNGGPGDPSGQVHPLFVSDLMAGVTLEFISIDHRGCGHSSEITCPDGSLDYFNEECFDALKEREDIKYYTVTNAARDVLRVAGEVRIPGKPLLLYGESYGTYWAQRVMLLGNNSTFNGAVLSSVVNPEETLTAEYDRAADLVHQMFLSTCDHDRFCSSLWGGTPTQDVLQYTIRSIKDKEHKCVSQHFPYLDGPDGVKRFQQALHNLDFLALHFYERVTVIAILYRINRCNEEDVGALKFFFEKKGLHAADWSPIMPDPSWNAIGKGIYNVRSNGIYWLIGVLSELWWNSAFGPAPTLDEIRTANDRRLITTYKTEVIQQMKEKGFPTFEVDEYYRQIPIVTYPVLLLNGEWDAATPMWNVLHLRQKRPSWNLIRFPYMGHLAPMGLAVGIFCPLMALDAFSRDPNFNPNTLSCIPNHQIPFDFSAKHHPYIGKANFNTDLFGPDPTKIKVPPEAGDWLSELFG